MEFKLGTWNIWGLFADWEKRRQVLSEVWPKVSKPNILCLQEVCVNNQYNQLNDLAEIMDYSYQAFAPALIRGDTVEGVAVLSNYPIDKYTILELPHADQRRVALQAEISKLQINIVSTHLSFYPAKENSQQIRFLLELKELRDTNTFIAADLNIIPQEFKLLSDLFIEWRNDTSFDYTWPNDIEQFKLGWREKTGYSPTFEIEQSQLDYILTNQSNTYLKSSNKYELLLDDQYASDHSLIVNDYYF